LMLWGEKMRFTFRSPLDQQRKIYSLFENLRTQQQASYLIGRFSALKAFSFAIEEYIRQENESKEQQDKSKKKKKN